MLRDTSAIVYDYFVEQFGAQPEGVWSAPGRISLMGDHTDIEDGMTLAHATVGRSAVAMSRRTDNIVRVRTDMAQDVAETTLDALAPTPEHHWYDYPLGTVWAALAHVAEHNDELSEDEEAHELEPTGLDIVITTDVLIGAGLASSASVCAAVAIAINDLWGLGLTPYRLARFGYHVENDYVGASAGIADHVTSMCAEEGKDIFFDARGGDVTLLDAPPLNELGLTQLLVYSGEGHRNWERIVADRHEACDRVAKALGYQYLREVKFDEFQAATNLDPVDRRRAHYILTEMQRVLDLTRVLRTDGIAHVGPIYNESQRSLREDFEATTPRIDLVCDLAAASGAIAARMTGSGFGGSVWVLIPTARVAELRANLEAAFAEYGWGGLEVWGTHSADGPRRDR